MGFWDETGKIDQHVHFYTMKYFYLLNPLINSYQRSHENGRQFGLYPHSIIGGKKPIITSFESVHTLLCFSLQLGSGYVKKE